jgi:opacity protein-like surface antigen
MRRLLFFILFIITVTASSAQDDMEYKMEIGGGVGMMAYEGDFNNSITKDMQPSASVILRRVISPYMDLRANISYGKVKGSSKDATTYFPDQQSTPVEFNNTLMDFDAIYEYNFLPYGTGRDYRGAKRVAPYILVGLGGTYVKTDAKDVFTANLPLGFGVKYKLKDRLNVGLEWVMHFSLSDELDGVKDPYGIKSSGLFKNTDCYSVLQLTLTYSFMPKCRTCHNDDE